MRDTTLYSPLYYPTNMDHTYLFTGSADHLEFALGELEALFGKGKFQQDKDLFFADMEESKEKYFSRLAYVQKVQRILFTCSVEEVEQKISDFDWNNAIIGTYKVKCTNVQNHERKFADLIWRTLSAPKVSMKNPDVLVDFVKDGNKMYATVFLCDNTKNFEARRNKYRPRPHPTGLHPKFARFLINISGVHSGILLDPFCGIGGILMEAALLGYHVKGQDLSDDMLMRADENFKFYGLTRYHLRYGNSEEIKEISDVIVTDVPYGKNSMINDKKDIEETYKKFLASAYGKTQKIVVVFPSFANFRPTLGKWKIEKEFQNYIHKSLTRHILVLSP